MATQTKPVTPNFKDVDKEAAQRAQAAVQGGRQEPLTPPKGARPSTDKKGKEYIRWTEAVTITAAYRTVSKKGLMDIVVAQKIRQSDEKKNNGKTFFAHFYMDTSANPEEKYVAMNDRTMGAIMSLLTATGLMPSTGTPKGSFLAKMFPEKGKPGDPPSPLVGKGAIANVVQQIEPAIDQKTGKPQKDAEGDPVMAKRDGAETYLPETDSSDDEE